MVFHLPEAGKQSKKIRFEWKRLGTYFVIEWELFINVFRRFLERA